MTPEQFEFMALTTSYTEALWRCVPAKEVALMASLYVMGTGDKLTIEKHLPRLLSTPATKEALIMRIALLHRKYPNAFTFPPPNTEDFYTYKTACYAHAVVTAACRCAEVLPTKSAIHANLRAALQAYPGTHEHAFVDHYRNPAYTPHALDILLRWAFSADEAPEEIEI